MRTTSKIPALTLVSALAVSGISEASLTIDFRLQGGSKTMSFAAGDLTPVTIQAWAIVSGAAGNPNEEGLLYAIFAARSSVTVGSGFAGGISSAQQATGWNGSGSTAGSATNLSADGIGDWGNASNTPLTLTSNFFRPRSSKSVNNPVEWGDGDSVAGSIHNSLADGGEEFLIGNLTWTPTNTAPGGTVTYSPVVPLGGSVPTAGWYQDTTDKTSSSPLGGTSPSSGTYGPQTPNSSAINAVSITYLPEPTSIGLLGLLGMGLMKRGRKAGI